MNNADKRGSGKARRLGKSGNRKSKISPRRRGDAEETKIHRGFARMIADQERQKSEPQRAQRNTETAVANPATCIEIKEREIGIQRRERDRDKLSREFPDAALANESSSGSFHSRSLARLVRGRSG
jgi:hypothetical protein